MAAHSPGLLCRVGPEVASHLQRQVRYAHPRTQMTITSRHIFSRLLYMQLTHLHMRHKFRPLSSSTVQLTVNIAPNTAQRMRPTDILMR